MTTKDYRHCGRLTVVAFSHFDQRGPTQSPRTALTLCPVPRAQAPRRTQMSEPNRGQRKDYERQFMDRANPCESSDCWIRSAQSGD